MGLVQVVIGAILAAVGWASLTIAPLHAVARQGAAALPGADGAINSVAAGLGFGATIGGGLLVLFGLLGVAVRALSSGDKDPADDPRARERQLEAFHELLAGSVGRMVGIDGQITPSELGMVAGVVEKFGGVRVGEATIKRLSEGGEEGAQRFAEDMKSRGAALTEEQKEHIVRASLLVAMADLTFDETESRFLNQIAASLGMSDAKLAEIRSSVTDVAQKLVGAAAFAA